MPGLMQNLIASALPDPSTQTVRLVWQDGSVTQAEFARLARDGVFAALGDPDFFVRAAVADDGRILAWPGDLEFDADALWFEAHPEDAPRAAVLQS